MSWCIIVQQSPENSFFDLCRKSIFYLKSNISASTGANVMKLWKDINVRWTIVVHKLIHIWGPNQDWLFWKSPVYFGTHIVYIANFVQYRTSSVIFLSVCITFTAFYDFFFSFHLQSVKWRSGVRLNFTFLDLKSNFCFYPKT